MPGHVVGAAVTEGTSQRTSSAQTHVRVGAQATRFFLVLYGPSLSSEFFKCTDFTTIASVVTLVAALCLLSCLAQLGFRDIKSCRASRCARSSASFLNGGRLRLDDHPYACIYKTAFGAG